MDDRRFDELVRSLGAGRVSRRAAVRVLVGGVLGGLLTWLGLEEAAAGCAGADTGCTGDGGCAGCARTVCQVGRCCRPPGKPCAKGGDCCSGRCNAKKRRCRGCPAGTEPCGGACVDAGTCGGGGTPCPAWSGDKICNESTDGVCRCPPDKPVQCEFNSTRCSAGPTSDSTRCGLHCYDCAVSFAPGYQCCNGQCVNGCGPSTSGSCQQDPCGSSCLPCTGGKVCCNLGPGTSSQCVDPVFPGGYCPTA